MDKNNNNGMGCRTQLEDLNSKQCRRRGSRPIWITEAAGWGHARRPSPGVHRIKSLHERSGKELETRRRCL